MRILYAVVISETRREIAMEVPSSSQLSLLLQEDRAFRDYFNTFLRLPIFCRRFSYNVEAKKFEIDPPLQSPDHMVDDAAVMSWVHAHRLPLFWKSDLYHEYSLCLEITTNNSHCSDSSLLAGVEQMNWFRQFLMGTDGESACLFWLEVQQLLHLLHSGQIENWDVARFIDRIRTNFTNDDAPFRLNREIRTKLSTEFCSLSLQEVNQRPPSTTASLSNTHSRYLQVIVEAQAQVISILKGYWYKKYVCNEMINSGLEPSKIVPPHTKCSDDASTTSHLPDIVTDEGQSTYYQKVAPAQLRVKLPDIDSENGGCCSIKRAGRAKQPLAKSSQVMPLFSPSTAELLPHTDMPLKMTPKVTENDYLRLDPFLSAALRADFLAGHPFLTYLSHSQLHKKAVNALLFWQSAEVMFMQDEMRRFHQSRKSGNGKQQRERGCPYTSYTDEIYPTAKNPAELVQLYLTKGSPHMIELPRHTCEELTLLLPKGLGQSLLISVQELVAQQLLSPWKNFLNHDHHNFLKHCIIESVISPANHTSPAKASLSPTEVVQLTYRSPCLKGMWMALRLAEISKYPGTANLPSRRLADMTLVEQETEVVARDSAMNKEHSRDVCIRDLTGISLNPMLTTVSHSMRRNTKRSLHTILSITEPAHSIERDSKKKKVLPGHFREILKDREQMEQFHKFLVAQGSGCEVQLLFWLAVEDLKSCMSNARVCSRKMGRIVRNFFKNRDTLRVLQCPDHEPLVACVGSQNPFDLLAAQAAIAEAMERQWYGRYIASLTVEDKKKEEETGDAEPVKKTVEHTKDLWRMFAQGVISFRRGLMNPGTAEDFKSYLREEVVRGSSGSHRKMVGTKVVYVTKLLNDLSFWAEVERYKDMADIVRASKKGRTHTPEDDIMVHKKAHAIINCFIDSAVMPRVQINIPNELVQYILDCVSEGQISRGLFHEAALNIFSVLIIYWRKYLVIRHTHKKKADSLALATNHHHLPHNLPPRTLRPPNLHKVASFDMFHPDNHIFLAADIGPTLSFSLSDGLHWVHPSHRQHFEFTTVDQLSSNFHLKPHRRPSHRPRTRTPSIRRLDQGERSQRSMKRMSRHATTTALSITTTAPPAVHS